MVRRITPVTERCQPPSRVTRGALPPPPSARGSPPAAAGAGPPRAGGAAAPASRPPLPLPRRRPRRRPHRRTRAARAPRPPCPQPRRAGCAGACPVCGGCHHRPRAQTGSPRPPRRRCQAETTRTPPPSCDRSFTRLGVVRRGHEGGARGRVGVEGWLHVLVGRLAGPLHAQLLEQEGERLLEVGPDGRPHALRQIPEPLLEGPDRLLAALIEELLLGVALFPLFLRLGLDPLVHIPPQIGRQGAVLHD